MYPMEYWKTIWNTLEESEYCVEVCKQKLCKYSALSKFVSKDTPATGFVPAESGTTIEPLSEKGD